MNMLGFSEAHADSEGRANRLKSIERVAEGDDLLDWPEGVEPHFRYTVHLPYEDSPELDGLRALFSSELAQRVDFAVGTVAPGTEQVGCQRILAPEEWEGLKSRLPLAFEKLPSAVYVSGSPYGKNIRLHPGDRLSLVQQGGEGSYVSVEDLIIQEYIKWLLEKGFKKRSERKSFGLKGSYKPIFNTVEARESGVLARQVASFFHDFPIPLPRQVVDALFLGDQFEIEASSLPLNQLTRLQVGEWVLFESDSRDVGYPRFSFGCFQGKDNGKGRMFNFLYPSEDFSRRIDEGVSSKEPGEEMLGRVYPGRAEHPSKMVLRFGNSGSRVRFHIIAVHRIITKNPAS
ncbi:MAG: hypothetical protein WCW30_00625 [Candidatus Gracilibacteria bacterium]